jgi:hypothetical protein
MEQGRDALRKPPTRPPAVTQDGRPRRLAPAAARQLALDERALAVAMRALAHILLDADLGQRLAIAAAADRRIRAALARHAAQAEADAAAAAYIVAGGR